ncbi:MAG: ComEC/Rec2 family competence protein [Solirubrobacterales bacterium]|nr:ComEC/Rec2 family competence protein [Solirubrobacterales bacterium]
MRALADWRVASAVGGAVGLAASPFVGWNGGWLRPAVTAGLVGLALIERGRVGWSGLLLLGLAAALVGVLVGQARLDAIDGRAYDGDGAARLSGFVVAEPSTSRGVTRFQFATDRGRVLVEAPAGEEPRARVGLGLEVRGDVADPPDWLAGSLRRMGISRVLRAEEMRPTGRRRGGLSGVIDGMRDRAAEALGVGVPVREASLSRGFVLGQDDGIDERTEEDFRRSGLAHLLAVSGQNVVLLAVLAMPFLAVTGIGPRARLVVVAGLILLYVPLAGGGPSIQRAGAMGVAGMIAALATRAPSRVYALAVAALVTLGLDPRATADIGWQLSFVAVVGIMLMARPFQTRLAGLVGGDGWRGSFAEAVAVTFAATIATAPLTALHFEQLPVGVVPANIVALPAVAPAMWAGMISVAVGQIDPVLAAPFNLLGSVCLAWIAQVAEWFGRPGWATVGVKIGGPVGLIAVWGIVGAAVLAGLRIWKRGRAIGARGLAVGAALALAAGVLLLPGLIGGGRRHLSAPPAHGARVEVLDVGQGDAILIRPWNRDPLLIDGGPPDGDLAGALESADVDRLAAVLLTHPDLDHYGGLMGLFGLVPVERFVYDRAPPELIDLARASGARMLRAQAGQVLRDGDVRLDLIWPPAAGGPSPAGPDTAETNLRSIVALLEYRRFRMLLTGDAEAESVPIGAGPIDVLKVSHHGSEDSGLESLLDHGSPRAAVISVGEGNRYGHPVDSVLAALSEDGVRTMRTDRDGTVSIVLDGGSWQIETGA